MKHILLFLLFSIPSFALDARPLKYKVIDTASVFHAEDNSTSIYVRAWFEAPLNELLAIVDPQNWDECSSFFKHTYLVKPGTLQRLEDAPPAGTPWEGELYEEVSVELAGATLSNIRNVLWFKGGMSSNGLAYEWTYGIKESLSTILAGRHFKGGIFIDDGRIRIESLGKGRWLLDGVKRVGFKLANRKMTYIMNETNGLTYRTFLDKLMRQFGTCDLSATGN